MSVYLNLSFADEEGSIQIEQPSGSRNGAKLPFCFKFFILFVGFEPVAENIKEAGKDLQAKYMLLLLQRSLRFSNSKMAEIVLLINSLLKLFDVDFGIDNLFLCKNLCFLLELSYLIGNYERDLKHFLPKFDPVNITVATKSNTIINLPFYSPIKHVKWLIYYMKKRSFIQDALIDNKGYSLCDLEISLSLCLEADTISDPSTAKRYWEMYERLFDERDHPNKDQCIYLDGA
jgi:hypothetical protein